MTGDDSVPTAYHEFLELAENNDDYVVAEVLNNNYVPIEELEALADELDKDANALMKPPTNAEVTAQGDGLMKAAQELREVIEQYE